MVRLKITKNLDTHKGDAQMNGEKDCNTCVNNGNQMIYPSGCTGCGDGEYKNFKPMTQTASELLEEVYQDVWRIYGYDRNLKAIVAHTAKRLCEYLDKGNAVEIQKNIWNIIQACEGFIGVVYYEDNK